VGEILNRLLPLPVPAGIYGIVLLFIALETKIITVDSIRETGNFFIDIMPVTLIPAGVELMNAWGVLKPNLLKFVCVMVVSTFTVMAVSGRVTQAVIRMKEKRAKAKQ
jgi:holin-like protein